MKESIKTLVVAGYRAFELGIFQEKDPKIQVIKKVLKNELKGYAENGLEWVLIGGNLGVELWAIEVLSDLKAEYPDLKSAVILPFKEFGSQWNESNRQKLQAGCRLADYVNETSKRNYESPQQLRSHSRFLLEHSGGVLLIHDPEFPGKAQFFLKEAEYYSKSHEYLIHQITMDDLQNSTDFLE